MSVTQEEVSKEARVGHLFIGLAALVPLVAFVAPLGLTSILVVAAVAAVVLAPTKVVIDAVPRGPAIIVGLFLAWALASAAWSIEPEQSIAKFGQLAVLCAAGLVLMGASRAALPDEARRIAGRALVFSVGVTLALFVAEYVLGAPIARFLNGSEDYGLGWQMTRHNRAASVIAISSIPAAVIIARHVSRKGVALFVVAVIVSLSLLQSRTAVASALVATAVAAIALWRPLLARGLAVLVVVLSIILSPYLPALIPSDSTTISEMRAEAMKYNVFSVFHRLRIWEFSVERIEERPVLGWGLNTSRSVPGGKAETDAGGEVMSLHPHNAQLQIRLELGIPGVLLIGMLVLWPLLAARRLNDMDEVIMLSTTMAALVTASMSYGVWQSWWFSTLWLSAAVIVPSALAPAGSQRT